MKRAKLLNAPQSAIVKFWSSFLAITLAAFGMAPASAAAQAAPITSVRAARSLTNEEARKESPVDFEATVTYARPFERTLFVEEDGAAIYVDMKPNLKLVPGDLVRVRGTLMPSFKPYVVKSKIDLLGHGAVPAPKKVTHEQLRSGEMDCQLVTVKAHILSADFAPSGGNNPVITALDMLIDGEKAEATFDSSDPDLLKQLLDADVQLTAVAGERFDNKMQQTGILLHIQSPQWIKILSHTDSDPWSLPVTPMSLLYGGYAMRDESQRMHVHGAITYFQPGSALVLQDGARTVWITTATFEPLRIGDVADAIGFPDVQNGFLNLTRSEVHDTGVQAPVVPALYSWRELASGGNESGGHNFDLVSIEGKVVKWVRQGAQDEYILSADGQIFSAIVRHPAPGTGIPLPAMREVPIGSRVRVTGICMLHYANPFNGGVPFDILLRSSDDIVVAADPPWLDVPHLTMIVIVLLLVVFIFALRMVWTERLARRHNAQMAYLERRRGKILEDINNSKPLAEILELITELVSSRLNGAPCWCKVADGAVLGSCPGPAFMARLRVVEKEIPARTGGSLGKVFAAFDGKTIPGAGETDALKQAAGLAALAIETSRLYSDLVHRSEFDLLTEIHNRFSFEKQLEAMIEACRKSASAFGLLYVDLNDFKLVNDQYGHRTGDQYLQEVALRMKRQLRPGDVLGRLGGDEFAVIVAGAHLRSDVEVVARRLEACFLQPFQCGAFAIRGSASIGVALYPEEGSTKDSLLSAADAAMYVVKQTRKGDGEERSSQKVY